MTFQSDGESLEPVPGSSFLCRGCQRARSQLPACIAPRRRQDWLMQQAVRMLLLGEGRVPPVLVITFTP